MKGLLVVTAMLTLLALGSADLYLDDVQSRNSEGMSAHSRISRKISMIKCPQPQIVFCGDCHTVVECEAIVTANGTEFIWINNYTCPSNRPWCDYDTWLCEDFPAPPCGPATKPTTPSTTATPTTPTTATTKPTTPTTKHTNATTKPTTPTPTTKHTNATTKPTTKVPTTKHTNATTKPTTKIPTTKHTNATTKPTTKIPTTKHTNATTKPTTKIPTTKHTNATTKPTTPTPTTKHTNATTKPTTKVPTTKHTNATTKPTTKIPTTKHTNATTKPTSPPPTYQCPPSTAPHPQLSCADCHTVLICQPHMLSNGSLEYIFKRVEGCPAVRPFCSEITGTCTDIEPENCANKEDEFICLREGYFPSRNNCSQYHHCDNNFVSERLFCGVPEETYNADTQKCGKSETCAEFRCDQSGLKVASKEYPSYWGYCNGPGEAPRVISKCPGIQKLNETSGECEAICEEEGLLQDDNDSQHYFKCSYYWLNEKEEFMIREHRKCPDNQVFCPQEYMCVSPEDYPDCV